MELLNISNDIQQMFINGERNSDTKKDMILFKTFIDKLEQCNINYICGFYVGWSTFAYKGGSGEQHTFHPEYIIISNKQSSVLKKNNKRTNDNQEQQNKQQKRGGKRKSKSKHRKKIKSKKIKTKQKTKKINKKRRR